MKNLHFLKSLITSTSLLCLTIGISFPEEKEKQPEDKWTPKLSMKYKSILGTAMSPDGKLIATGGNDNLVKLWNADGTPLRELAGHASNVYSTFFHPGGKFLLSGDLAGEVRQWEVSTGKLVGTFDANAPLCDIWHQH